MKRFFSFATVLAGIIAIASGCNNISTSQTSNADSAKTDSSASMKPMSIKPMGPKPAWGQDLHPEMQAVLEKLASYNDPAIPTLTAVQARMNHTPADA
jgi:acetyl esterase